MVIMKVFLLVFLFFLLAFAGLAVNLFFRRPGLRRTCGRDGAACRCEGDRVPEDCDCN